MRLVALHDDWLGCAPQRVLLRRSDHLHQLQEQPPQRRHIQQGQRTAKATKLSDNRASGSGANDNTKQYCMWLSENLQVRRRERKRKKQRGQQNTAPEDTTSQPKASRGNVRGRHTIAADPWRHVQRQQADRRYGMCASVVSGTCTKHSFVYRQAIAFGRATKHAT